MWGGCHGTGLPHGLCGLDTVQTRVASGKVFTGDKSAVGNRGGVLGQGRQVDLRANGTTGCEALHRAGLK